VLSARHVRNLFTEDCEISYPRLELGAFEQAGHVRMLRECIDGRAHFGGRASPEKCETSQSGKPLPTHQFDNGEQRADCAGELRWWVLPDCSGFFSGRDHGGIGYYRR
jgi:hypothetical protein